VRGGDGVDYRAGEGEVLSPGGGHGNILADAAVVAREEVEGGPAGDDARALVVQQGQGVALEDGGGVAEGFERDAGSETAEGAANLEGVRLVRVEGGR